MEIVENNASTYINKDAYNWTAETIVYEGIFGNKQYVQLLKNNNTFFYSVKRECGLSGAITLFKFHNKANRAIEFINSEFMTNLDVKKMFKKCITA